MYIRRTHTNNSATGERYYTYRLIENRRIDGKPRQIILLNLGKHFAVNQDHWATLCIRIDEVMRHQASLFPMDFPPSVELEAQRIAAQLLTKQAETYPKKIESTTEPTTSESVTTSIPPSTPISNILTIDIQSVDIDSLEMIRPRSVGVEQVGLWAMQQLDFTNLLIDVGLNATQRSAAIGSIIARMAAPSSELAAHHWLGTQSALGELLDVDYAAMSLNALYRASDVLWKHHAAIEQRLFNNVSDLFELDITITLYDLTNTYFEGEVPNNSKAKHGRSKEKRSDCPLVTLGLVLDGSGFVRSSQTFAGNVSEAGTLEIMLKGLNAPSGALPELFPIISGTSPVPGGRSHHGCRYCHRRKYRLAEYSWLPLPRG
jgi:hypothetical protein